MKNIEKLESCKLNLMNLYSCYDYSGYSLQELLCQFFEAINQCIENSKEMLELAKWLVNEGLSQEVLKTLNQWKDDGTLARIINEEIFQELNNKIIEVENGLNEYKTSNDQKVLNLENDNSNIKKLMKVPLGKPKFSTLAFLPDNNLETFVMQSMCFNYNTKTIVVLYASKDTNVQDGYLVGYDSENFTVKQEPVKLVTHHGNGITYVDKGEIQEYKIATSINKVLTVGTDFQKKYEEELEVPYVQGIAHYKEKDDNIIAYTKDSTYYLAYQKRISETSVYYEKNEYGACQDIEIGDDYIIGIYQWGIRYFDKETLKLIKEYPVPSYPKTELQGICKYYSPNNIWEPRKNTFLTGLLGFRSTSENIHGTTIGTDIMAPRLMKFNNSVDDLNDTKITKNGYLNMEIINLAYTFEKQADNSWKLIDDYSNPNSHLTNNITSFKRTSPQYALFENTLDFWATQSQGLIYDIVNSQCEIVPYVTGTQVPCGVTSYYYSRSGLYVRFYELSTGATKEPNELPEKTRVRCAISLRIRNA